MQSDQPQTARLDRLHAARASAPAKVILFGEHAVNRGQAAWVAGVDLRTHCVVTPQPTGFTLRAEGRAQVFSAAELRSLKAGVEGWLSAGRLEPLRAQVAREFFYPTAYVLAHLLERLPLSGAEIAWTSALPIGSGLGSGAAASAAMIAACTGAVGVTWSPAERTALAWQGDIVAHGGVASALDSSGCTYGGLVRYSLAAKAEPLPLDRSLTLVVAHTGVRAATAEVNAGVQRRLAAAPERMGLFAEIGRVGAAGESALLTGDWATAGRLLDRNQELLAEIGVSTPEIERLAAAMRQAGAYGSKLSGSGGGGIVIALVEAGDAGRVAKAAERAGAVAVWQVTAGVEGAGLEDE